MDASSSSAVFCLVWRCQGRIGAVPVRHVAEIMRPLPADRLADAPPFVSGISIIRGKPTPILDGSLLISGNPGAPTRFVIVRIDEERSVGLAVDDVIGVRELAGSLLAQLPPLLQDSEGAGIARIAALDGELLVVLETARLVPDSVWQGLGERAG
jgi:purine-binding chemotaxis protein CheW